jgi:hypothetical protein
MVRPIGRAMPYPTRQKDWRHVQSRRWFDGNGTWLTVDGRACRAGARRNASSVGNPALPEGAAEKVRRKYRKSLAALRRVGFLNDIRRLGVSAAAGLRRMGLAEIGGNWRKPLACTTNPAIEGGGRSHHLLSLRSLTRASRSPPLRSEKSIRTFSSSLL